MQFSIFCMIKFQKLQVTCRLNRVVFINYVVVSAKIIQTKVTICNYLLRTSCYFRGRAELTTMKVIPVTPISTFNIFFKIKNLKPGKSLCSKIGIQKKGIILLQQQVVHLLDRHSVNFKLHQIVYLYRLYRYFLLARNIYTSFYKKQEGLKKKIIFIFKN